MYRTISCLLILGLGTWVGGMSSAPQFPRIVAKVALTNQTGSIPTTTLLTPTQSALYRISVYMVQVFPQTSDCTGYTNCGFLQASYQWTDDGGNQTLSTPFFLQLYPASGGQDSCAQYGRCFPLMINGLSGATFLVRANAGTPVNYSVEESSEYDGSYLAYDYYMTVEQLE